MPLPTPALLVHTAGQAFERGTVDAPRRRPARRADRHRLRGHLPLRHPPGPRGVGPGDLPDGARPRDRRHRRARSAPSVTKHAVGDRVGIGCFVDSCRECENCLAGEEQFCLQGQRRHLQRPRRTTAAPPTAATAPRSSWTRTTCCAFPTASRSTPPLRCCAPASRPIRRCATGAPGPGKRVAVDRHGRARPHGRSDRARHGRARDGALADAGQGGRGPGAWAPTTTSRRRTRRRSSRCAAGST